MRRACGGLTVDGWPDAQLCPLVDRPCAAPCGGDDADVGGDHLRDGPLYLGPRGAGVWSWRCGLCRADGGFDRAVGGRVSGRWHPGGSAERPAGDHPLGGGFDAYRGNRIRFNTIDKESAGNTTDIEATVIEDKARAYHSSYFEMLGEQGWPGFLAWIWLQLLGLWQMERLRSRWLKRDGPGEQWQSPLGNALQQLRRELIDAARVAISPAACFALLTPLIDARLGNLQQQLGTPA